MSIQASAASVSQSVPATRLHEVPLRHRASVFTDEMTLDFAVACQTAAQAGLHYVDIRRLWDVYSHDVPRLRWAEMQTILRDHGLQLGAIQSNFGKCAISGPEYDAHIGFFPTLVEQAHYFGTGTIRIFPFWNAVKMTYTPAPPGGIRPNLEATLPEIVRQLQPAVRLAEQAGIHLGFEPEHSTYSGSPQEVARIVEAIGSPNVGVAWDVNNGWDDAPLDEAFALFTGKVVNVHIKERATTPTQRQAIREAGGTLGPERVLLGQGAMPWPEVIERLERGGYRGLYTIETHTGRAGAYGWPKLKAVTTFYLYALREILETVDAAL